MKQLKLVLAVLALTLLAFFPAAVRADDELKGLDVTMIVLDNKADLDVEMSEMSGPEGNAVSYTHLTLPTTPYV